MAGFAKGMGSAWSDTVVAIVTEFGRTVRINGTHGTDHGLATRRSWWGGAVNGGRVIADWPGLRRQISTRDVTCEARWTCDPS